MTTERARELYMAAIAGSSEWNTDYTAHQWEDIRLEIEQVISAPSDRAAGKLIAWWGCWDRKDTATSFARRIREANSSVATKP